MQTNEPIPEDVCAAYVFEYRSQSEINYEHILNIQSELLTIHAKIDMILEALKQ